MKNKSYFSCEKDTNWDCLAAVICDRVEGEEALLQKGVNTSLLSRVGN